MRSIIKNKFFEFNFILFPIWIALFYLPISHYFGNKELIFFLALLIFGETHFASTFLFYFNKNNKEYINQNKNLFIYIPLTLIIIYFIIGIFNLKTAVILGAIASGIHVTRQSIGIQRLYADKKNYVYELLVYFSSFLFLAVGFYRFYLNELISLLNLDLSLIDLSQTSFRLIFIIFLIIVSLFSFFEKTNLKKRFSNLTGVLIYSPYLFVNNIYDAIIIGVGAHWCQYLALNYKIYFFREKYDLKKNLLVIFIVIYAFIMSSVSYAFDFGNIFNLLILIPLSGQFFHYYVDMYIWKFSDTHIRSTVGSKLFS